MSTSLELNFEVSELLQEFILNSKYSEKELEKFRKEIQEWFGKNKATIIEKIQNFTGLDFEEGRIDVWVFDSYHHSVPVPLLIEYNELRGFSFFLLLRELTKRLLFDKGYSNYKSKRFDENKIEAYCYLVAKKISREMLTKEILNQVEEKAKRGGTYRHIQEKAEEIDSEYNLDEESVGEILH